MLSTGLLCSWCTTHPDSMLVWTLWSTCRRTPSVSSRCCWCSTQPGTQSCTTAFLGTVAHSVRLTSCSVTDCGVWCSCFGQICLEVGKKKINVQLLWQRRITLSNSPSGLGSWSDVGLPATLAYCCCSPDVLQSSLCSLPWPFRFLSSGWPVQHSRGPGHQTWEWCFCLFEMNVHLNINDLVFVVYSIGYRLKRICKSLSSLFIYILHNVPTSLELGFGH